VVFKRLDLRACIWVNLVNHFPVIIACQCQSLSIFRHGDAAVSVKIQFEVIQQFTAVRVPNPQIPIHRGSDLMISREERQSIDMLIQAKVAGFRQVVRIQDVNPVRGRNSEHFQIGGQGNVINRSLTDSAQLFNLIQVRWIQDFRGGSYRETRFPH